APSYGNPQIGLNPPAGYEAYFTFPSGADRVAWTTTGPTINGRSSVKKYRNWGVGDQTPFSVPSNNVEPTPRFREVFLATEPRGAGHLSMALLNSRMVLSYVQPSTLEVFWVEALNATPASTADWSSHVITTTTGTGGNARVLITPGDGRPVLYVEGSSPRMLLTASTPSPRQASDWTRIDLALSGSGFRANTGRGCLRDDGRIVFAQLRTSVPGIYLAETTTLHPLSIADVWRNQVLPELGTLRRSVTFVDWSGSLMGIADSGGGAAHSSIIWAPDAQTEDPAAWQLYDFLDLDQGPATEAPLLSVRAGGLWLTRFEDVTFPFIVQYGSSLTPPKSEGDWFSETAVFLGGYPPLEDSISLTLDGRPLIVYRGTRAARGLRPYPYRGEQWQHFFVLDDTSTDRIVGDGGTAAVDGTRLYVAYRSGGGLHDGVVRILATDITF
ncbi:MAG: hypothetical protein ABI743_14490, partial [bacterium]